MPLLHPISLCHNCPHSVVFTHLICVFSTNLSSARGQALCLSCLPLDPLTRGPGPWMLHKYLLTDALSWSGQRWDLDPGASDSQGTWGLRALADSQELGFWGSRELNGP